jgi:glycosyltransferase involved in cell wall biosynthesis
VKILITTEQFYPVQSGVSTAVTSVAKELAVFGHEVTVVTGTLDRKGNEIENVKIVEFKISGGFGNYYRGEISEYREFVKNFHCDVIINECVQNWSTDLLLDMLDDLEAKKILHSHGFSLLHMSTKNLWAYLKAKFYYRNLHNYLKRYDHIFLLHDQTVETPYLKKHGVKHFSYLPNGVDEGFVIPSLQKKNPTYLLSISNYFPLKNQEFLLESYYKASTKYPLMLIGSSSLKNYYKKLENLKHLFDKKYGYKEVVFLWGLQREKTEEYLENASLFLHSSKLEVFPMVIIESMAKGIPFLSTDVGNVAQLAGGMIVENKEDMAKKIDILLQDSVLRFNMALEGINYVRDHLLWSKIVKKFVGVMENE